jgi:3-methyladenine DNA glycosylase AlkD
VHSGYLETTINYISDEKDSSTVFINLPFEKFYMDEYKAPEAETIYRERNIDRTARVHALVMIYNGDAVVKNVYVNDSLINDVILNRRLVR